MNTTQYSPEGVRCMQQVLSRGPRQSSTQTASRSLQPFLQGLLGGRPTDRPTDHAIRLVTIAERAVDKPNAVIAYIRLQQVFIGAVDSTDRINFSNQQPYSAVRLDGLQCMWRHTTKINYVCLILFMLILN